MPEPMVCSTFLIGFKNPDLASNFIFSITLWECSQMALWSIQDAGTYGRRNVLIGFQKARIDIKLQVLDNALGMQSNDCEIS